MGTRKTATTTPQNLSLGIKEVQSLVATANDHPDLLCSRSRILKALSSATSKFDSVIQNRSDRNLLQIRKGAKRINNILISLANGVENDHLEPDDMIDTITTYLADEVEALHALSNAVDVDDDINLDLDLDGTLLGESSNELELGDMTPAKPKQKPLVRKEDYTRTVESLNKYDKSKEKLTSKLRRVSSVEPVELPLAVNFSIGRLQSPDALSSVFPGQVDLIGVNGAKSRDVGVVLRDQVVLQFSKSAAYEYAEDVANNSSASVQHERAKQLVKPLKSSYNKVQKSLEETVAKIEELVALQSKKPRFKFKGRPSPDADNSINLSLEALRKEEEEQKARLASIKEKLNHHEDRLRTATSLRNSVKRTKTEPTQAMVEMLTAFLNSLAEHGRNYVLMSTSFIPSPKNSDIMLAWVVTAQEHAKLSNLSGGNPSVSLWGPAWSSSKIIRSKRMPKSMFLSTKVK